MSKPRGRGRNSARKLPRGNGKEFASSADRGLSTLSALSSCDRLASIIAFEVALLESRPEGAATCQPRAPPWELDRVLSCFALSGLGGFSFGSDPQGVALGFSVSAPSGRQKSATPKIIAQGSGFGLGTVNLIGCDPTLRAEGADCNRSGQLPFRFRSLKWPTDKRTSFKNSASARTSKTDMIQTRWKGLGRGSDQRIHIHG